MILTDLSTIRDRLKGARRIAVLGCHSDPSRPAFYVPDYMHRRGYEIVPVNPALAGGTLFGEPVVATLAGQTFDSIDVFRRSDLLPAHLSDILAASAPGTLIWFQSGVRNDPIAQILSDAGHDVVQDRCMLADHRSWGLG